MKRAGENHLPVFFFRGGVAFRTGIKKGEKIRFRQRMSKILYRRESRYSAKEGKRTTRDRGKRGGAKKIEKSLKKDEKRC